MHEAELIPTPAGGKAQAFDNELSRKQMDCRTEGQTALLGLPVSVAYWILFTVTQKL